MQPRKDVDRTAYCQRQASACAKAAISTAVAEVKQAYLDLEQGWLCLAPKLAASTDPAANSEIEHDIGRPGPGLARDTNAGHAPNAKDGL